jgi:hypothetical protein
MWIHHTAVQHNLEQVPPALRMVLVPLPVKQGLHGGMMSTSHVAFNDITEICPECNKLEPIGSKGKRVCFRELPEKRRCLLLRILVQAGGHATAGCIRGGQIHR